MPRLQQIGSALGIAVLGTVLFTATQASIETRIVDLKSLSVLDAPTRQVLAEQIAKPVSDSAGAAIPAIPQFLTSQGMPQAVAEEVTVAAADGFTDGMKATGWAAAIFLLLGLASTINLGGKTKREKKAAKAKADA